MRVFVIKVKRWYLLVLLLLALVSLVPQLREPLIVSVTSKGRLVPIYAVQTDKKQVAISFDATWGTELTDEILEILETHGITTTFFLAGYWVDKHPDYVVKIADAGHEIGNHSYSHPHMNSLSEQGLHYELQKNQSLIQDLTGQRTTLFRPPFGEYSNKVVTAAEKCGYKSIQLSIDSLDWQELGKEPMVKRVTESLHPGAIILFHNNGKYTAEALPEIIAFVKEQSYKVVPVSELLYKENYYIDSNTGAQIQMPLQD